jgi:hypothetical protein
VEDPLRGRLHGREPGGVNDVRDRAQRAGGVGEPGHRVGFGDVGDLRGHVIALAAEQVGGGAQRLLVVVGEHDRAASAHPARDRQADAARAGDDRYVFVHRRSPCGRTRVEVPACRPDPAAWQAELCQGVRFRGVPVPPRRARGAPSAPRDRDRRTGAFPDAIRREMRRSDDHAVLVTPMGFGLEVLAATERGRRDGELQFRARQGSRERPARGDRGAHRGFSLRRRPVPRVPGDHRPRAVTSTSTATAAVPSASPPSAQHAQKPPEQRHRGQTPGRVWAYSPAGGRARGGDPPCRGGHGVDVARPAVCRPGLPSGAHTPALPVLGVLGKAAARPPPWVRGRLQRS